MARKTNDNLSNHERLGVYSVRNYEKDGEQRSSWTQIGTAFRCKDRSLNLLLDCVPLAGTINIRPFRERNAE